MSTPTFQHLRIADKQAVRTITLCNPKQLNALHSALLAELNIAINSLYTEKNLQAAILIGDGTRAFAAGADIKEFVGIKPIAAATLARRGQALFALIEACPIPVVAAVRGFALGGGCELAMACQLRVASPSARFGQPEVKLGLIPGYGGTQRLVQLIGKTKAMEWILTGATYTAEQALHAGLINHVVDNEEDLEPYIHQLLGHIQANSPTAVSAAISCINSACAHLAYEAEIQAFARCTTTQNFHEGTDAFLTKRKAVFSSR